MAITIDKSTRAELDAICSILRQPPTPLAEMAHSLFMDAVSDLLIVSGVEAGATYIIKNNPELTEVLGSVIKDKYPEHLEWYEKLMLLK